MLLNLYECVQSLICLLPFISFYFCDWKSSWEKDDCTLVCLPFLISHNRLGLPRRRFDWNFRVDKYYHRVTWIETRRMVREDISSLRPPAPFLVRPYRQLECAFTMIPTSDLHATSWVQKPFLKTSLYTFPISLVIAIHLTRNLLFLWGRRI